MRGKSCERGSGISVLPARHGDDDDDDHIVVVNSMLLMRPIILVFKI